ncbi:hypothetical protein DMT42_22235 [Streptomyces actuosus]|uniref:Uncharacterized protein n=2 Tax=Streptomyces TaxID=1883 RepID=A0A2U9P6E8_STRAS|nr:hypothetical protein DMT42_22235 [Streptomyces actuosus]
MVETHRFLDAPALRDLLSRANPEVTNTVVAISQRVYEDVFQSGLSTGNTVSAQYSQSIARVKTFAQPVWLHVPGLDWALADRSLFDVPDQSSDQSTTATPSAESDRPAQAPTFVQNGNGSYQGQFQYFTGPTGGNR